MAFWTRHSPEPARTASARRIKMSNRLEVDALSKRYAEWQRLGFAYIRTTGEIREALRFSANAISKVRILPARQVSPDENPTPVLTDETFAPILDLGNYGLNILRPGFLLLAIAGEFFLVGLNDRPGLTIPWGAYSRSELTGQDGRPKIRRSRDLQQGTEILLTDDDFLLRIWDPDPEYGDEPDSPMRSVLSNCENLALLNKAVRITTRSSFNAGLLTMAKELGLGPTEPSTEPSGDGEELSDPFLQDLVDDFAASDDEDNWQTLAPRVLYGDSEYLSPDIVRHINFTRQLDQYLDTRIERELRRIAQGLPVIPERLLTGEKTDRWSNARIPEDSYESYVSPALVTVLDAITLGYYRSALIERGMSESSAQELFLIGDPTAVITRPNRSQDADEAHDRFTISNEAHRRAKGFKESDAPDEAEVRERIEIRMAGRQQTAPQTPTHRDDTDRPSPADSTPSAPTNVPEPVKVASAAPTNGHSPTTIGKRLYDLDQGLSLRLEAAADLTVRRALDKAGAKIRTSTRNKKEISATIAAVPDREVCSVLSAQIISSLNFNAEDEAGKVVTAFHPQFDMWVETTQRRALDIIGADYDSAMIEAFDLCRTQAWRYYAEAVTRCAVDALWTGPVTSQPDTDHESTDLLVPYKVIRKTLFLAGNDPGDTSWQGGIGTGHVVINRYRELGGTVTGFSWSYGPALRRTDSPDHMNLDGAWIPSDMTFVGTDAGDHRPGQHDGCHCALIPLTVGKGG